MVLVPLIERTDALYNATAGGCRGRPEGAGLMLIPVMSLNNSEDGMAVAGTKRLEITEKISIAFKVGSMALIQNPRLVQKSEEQLGTIEIHALACFVNPGTSCHGYDSLKKITNLSGNLTRFHFTRNPRGVVGFSIL